MKKSYEHKAEGMVRHTRRLVIKMLILGALSTASFPASASERFRPDIAPSLQGYNAQGLQQILDRLHQKRQDTLEKISDVESALYHANKKEAGEAAIPATETDRHRIRSERENHTAVLVEKIKNTLEPFGRNDSNHVILRIKLLNSGEIAKVSIVQHNFNNSDEVGSRVFSYAAAKAIRDLRYLPVPQDREVFERYFRVFTISL